MLVSIQCLIQKTFVDTLLSLRKSDEQVRRSLSRDPLSVGSFGGGSVQMEQSENIIRYTINDQGLSVIELKKIVKKVKFMITEILIYMIIATIMK